MLVFLQRFFQLVSVGKQRNERCLEIRMAGRNGIGATIDNVDNDGNMQLELRRIHAVPDFLKMDHF